MYACNSNLQDIQHKKKKTQIFKNNNNKEKL